MKQIFLEDSPYKKRARVLAIIWTLLIFILCLLPGKDIPKVRIPSADKYVHIILFGGFAFLWLCGYPTRNIFFLIIIFFITVFFGWFIEFLQGLLKSLGRSKDFMDLLADSGGDLLAVLLFWVMSYLAEKSYDRKNKSTA